MEKLKLVGNLEDDCFGEPAKYEVFLNKGSNGYSYYYNDLYVKRGNEFIYRSFDGSHGPSKAQVRKGYEDKIREFIERHDLPCLIRYWEDIEVLGDVKVVN